LILIIVSAGGGSSVEEPL